LRFGDANGEISKPRLSKLLEPFVGDKLEFNVPRTVQSATVCADSSGR
jgi:hypothetical protein